MDVFFGEDPVEMEDKNRGTPMTMDPPDETRAFQWLYIYIYTPRKFGCIAIEIGDTLGKGSRKWLSPPFMGVPSWNKHEILDSGDINGNINGISMDLAFRLSSSPRTKWALEWKVIELTG